ncbi:DUF2283 domain-containing protein [Roseicella aquatilis]|uniref:DUF2283 domain-containing protein n=1 Tax=Roseicella aquatilis TaxID=2527868 RepID=A0A4R4D535_9PROT|nr:DUF2283 domain-containing protein [Roseicella aquatilis]TCZ53936.1 DUF2283 domain-containing protein [Roseicella aquatilis]
MSTEEPSHEGAGHLRSRGRCDRRVFPPGGAQYEASEDVAPGLVPDYDAAGRVIGVEIPGVARLLAERVIAAPEPAHPEKPAAE